ncbi:MAG: hypothetical protein UHD64_05590 [Bacteroidales bacterium]|nr:hypothetical protein [Bacteroidales bacterium]
MKKVAVFLAAIALTTGVFAQVTPNKTPIVWFEEQVQEPHPEWGNNQETAESTTGIRRNRAPLAPATLLLLGLGGAVVGTKVVRNRKK